MQHNIAIAEREADPALLHKQRTVCKSAAETGLRGKIVSLKTI